MNGTAHGPLGRWYADPPAHGVVTTLVVRYRRRLELNRRHGRDCPLCRLLLAAGQFWLHDGDDGELRHLHDLPQLTRRERALLLLVHGQLLMSRQRRDALPLLERGFDLATPLLHPADYFRVLNRHRTLAHLPLSGNGGPAQTLEELLKIAAVVERLQAANGHRAPYPIDHSDTYG